MSICMQESRCWLSLSAPTPRRGRCGKLGKKITAVGFRRHFRRTLSFTSPCGFTRDASAHVSAAVRRHFAPVATGRWWTPFAGCACALAASAVVLVPLASMPYVNIYTITVKFRKGISA